MRRVLATVLGALLMVLPGAGVEAAASRIGFVDVEKVLVRSAAGLAAREQLEKDRAAMQRELNTKKQEIDQLREEIEKKALLLSPDVKKEKEEALQRRVRDLRRQMEDYEKELAKKDQTLTKMIVEELAGIIARYGKEKGYLLILEKRNAGVIYGDQEADLTDEVIKLYDRERGQEKKDQGPEKKGPEKQGPEKKGPGKQ